MGATHSVELHANQPSVAEPGKLCIASASLDDLDPPLSVAQLFDALEVTLRAPPLAQLDSDKQHLMKFVDVRDHGPHDFTVKIVADGTKLDAAWMGRGDGCDKVLLWRYVTVDRTCQTIYMKSYVEEFIGGTWADEVDEADPSVRWRTRIQGLSAPFRLEVCTDIYDDQGRARRLASQGYVDAVHGKFDRLFKVGQKDNSDAVKVKHGAPSVKEPGLLSNISTPVMDVSREQLFDAMVAHFKECNGNAKQVQVMEASVSRFQVRVFMPELHDELIDRSADFRRDLAEIDVDESAVMADGSIAYPPWSRHLRVAIHQDPLVVESWINDQNGERSSSLVGARNLQSWINAAIGDLVE